MSISGSSAAATPAGRAEASARCGTADSPPSAPVVATAADSALAVTMRQSCDASVRTPATSISTRRLRARLSGVGARGERLVGAAAFDLDARVGQRRAQVVGDGLRARRGQRVVVGEACPVARRDRRLIGMADDVDRELAHAAPLGCDAVELGAVARVDLRLQRAETRRERVRVVARRKRVADALDDGFVAVHDVGDRRRALGAAERRREAQQRLQRLLADGIAGAARRKRHARRAVGGDLVEREAQRAVLRCRVRRRRTVERGAARHVLEAVGQQHEHLGLHERHGTRGDGGGVLEAVGRLRGLERQACVAGRCGALRDDEVGRAERAAAQVDELRRRVAGAAHARVAAQRLEVAPRSVIVSSCTTCEPGVTPSKWYLPSSSVTA